MSASLNEDYLPPFLDASSLTATEKLCFMLLERVQNLEDASFTQEQKVNQLETSIKDLQNKHADIIRLMLLDDKNDMELAIVAGLVLIYLSTSSNTRAVQIHDECFPDKFNGRYLWEYADAVGVYRPPLHILTQNCRRILEYLNYDELVGFAQWKCHTL